MNRGVPPTPRKARTGEFTPPGVTCCARANSASDLALFMEVLLCPVRIRHEPVEEQIHDDIVQRAVDVLFQAGLELEIILCAGKEVLHDLAERWAFAHELDHPRGYIRVEETAQEQPFREPGSEFQIIGEVALKQGTIGREMFAGR